MSATPDAIELARTAARAAAERKAEQIIAIDVSERLALTDVFLIVSGANDRQVRSIVDAVDEAMFKVGAKRKMREGFDEARWVLIDYGDIVVHVQQTEDREFYSLERLWRDCPLIDLPTDVDAADGAAGDAGDGAGAAAGAVGVGGVGGVGGDAGAAAGGAAGAALAE